MAYNQNDHDDDYYDEDITDGEPASNGTSARRYKSTNTPMLLGDAAYTTTRSRVPARRTMTVDVDSDYTMRIPADQRRQGDMDSRRGPRRQPDAQPGPRYLPRERYDEVQEELRTRRQPQRRQIQPQTTQPRVQRAQPHTTTQKAPLISKETGRTFLVGGLIIGALLLPSTISMPYSEGVHIVRQSQEGVMPSITLNKVFGHNHDSDLHPTTLHAFVTGDYIDFEEIPAGDLSKARGFQTESLSSIGYTGDKSEIYLEIIPQQAPDGKMEIKLTATMGGVGAWPAVQAISSFWILQDNGNYFVSVASK